MQHSTTPDSQSCSAGSHRPAVEKQWPVKHDGPTGSRDCVTANPNVLATQSMPGRVTCSRPVARSDLTGLNGVAGIARSDLRGDYCTVALVDPRNRPLVRTLDCLVFALKPCDIALDVHFRFIAIVRRGSSQACVCEEFSKGKIRRRINVQPPYSYCMITSDTQAHTDRSCQSPELNSPSSAHSASGWHMRVAPPIPL